jgi:beta-barrel assembly-enhancing protease
MNRLLNSLLLISLAAIIFVSPLAILAQTKIKAPRNFFGVETDVQAGQNAAMEAERQLPMLNDPMVNEYVFGVGRRLVQAIPPEFQIPQFRYSFKVVNAKDLNAFALPGGFTYINRGMIEACKSEGEMAGVMAHEISHVALRHGTAQASKAYMAQAGLGVLGAILGGGTGAAVAQQVSGLGLSVYFLKFSREYETQSDILGSHITGMSV